MPTITEYTSLELSMTSRTKLAIVKVSEGTVIVPDEFFECMAPREKRLVCKNQHGLFVICDEGEHYLEGQIDFDDENFYVGFSLV